MNVNVWLMVGIIVVVCGIMGVLMYIRSTKFLKMCQKGKHQIPRIWTRCPFCENDDLQVVRVERIKKTQVPEPEIPAPYGFVIVKNGKKMEPYILDKDVVSIGRAEDNDIVIPDDTASNHHGKITRENGRIFIWDLASTPGTIVDGEKIGKDSDISKKEIRDGSIITLTQKFELEFKAITPVQPATPRLAQPAA